MFLEEVANADEDRGGDRGGGLAGTSALRAFAGLVGADPMGAGAGVQLPASLASAAVGLSDGLLSPLAASSPRTPVGVTVPLGTVGQRSCDLMWRVSPGAPSSKSSMHSSSST